MARDTQSRTAPTSADGGELALGPLGAGSQIQRAACVRQESLVTVTCSDDSLEDLFDFSAWERPCGNDDADAQPRNRMRLPDAEASDEDGDHVEASAAICVRGAAGDLSIPSSVEVGWWSLKHGGSVHGTTTTSSRASLPRLTMRRLRRGGLSLDESVWASPAGAVESRGPSSPADGAARGSARAAVRQLRVPERSSPAEELRMTPVPPTQPKPAGRRPSNQAKHVIE